MLVTSDGLFVINNKFLSVTALLKTVTKYYSQKFGSFNNNQQQQQQQQLPHEPKSKEKVFKATVQAEHSENKSKTNDKQQQQQQKQERVNKPQVTS